MVKSHKNSTDIRPPRYRSHSRHIGWILAGFLAYLLLMTSCSQQYYVNKYCPKVKDSIRVEKITKDSLVYRDSIIKEPGEVITIHDSVPCPDMKYEKKGKKGSIKVEIKDSVMTAECIIDTTEIAFNWIEHHKKEFVSYFRSQVHQVTVKAPKTGFARFKDWWFYVTAILIVLRITLFILKKTGTFPISIKRSG
jgi:hypothetical protein